MQNLLEIIVVPFGADHSLLFTRSHSQLCRRIQMLLYIALMKIVIMTLLLSLNSCGFHQIDSWCLMYLIAQCFYITHYKNLKIHIANMEQMLNISLILEGQFSQTQLTQPSQKDVEEMIAKIRSSIQQLNPDIQREQKYIIIIGQVLICKFIFILTNYPFRMAFKYFDGNCNDLMLNTAFYLFIALFVEFIFVYIILILLIITIPLLLCAKLYQKVRLCLLLIRVRKQFYQFNTYEYQGEPGQECSICMANYEIGDTIMRLPCNTNHIFHKSCIKEWLQVSIECPLCRQPIIDPSLNLRHI